MIDVAGQLGMSGVPYDVVGLGWEVTIDAFIPSWLSDASIAIGSNPTFEFPDFVLVPGEGDDFGALRTYSSNGIRDLDELGWTRSVIQAAVRRGLSGVFRIV